MRYTLEGLKMAYDMNGFMSQGDFVYFWQPTEDSNVITKACLCQWYPSRFEIDGEMYSCAEQYMMAQKARIMGDEDTRTKIMCETAPEAIKKLGRDVKNFDAEKWDALSLNIVIKGNIAKFGQNPQLLGYLLSTGNKVLAEASPYDRIWGIGMDESEARELYPHKWRGQNKLGFALMEVRDMIREWAMEACSEGYGILNDGPGRWSHPFGFCVPLVNACMREEQAQIYYSYGGNTGMLKGRVAPAKIDKLEKNGVFVFGSNIEGHHKGGASYAAYTKFGAKWGESQGHHGQSFAIVTTEGLIRLAMGIDAFIEYAAEHRELDFFVTEIGCGNAGYEPIQIAPLFRRALILPNVYLPRLFWEYYWITNGSGPDYFVPGNVWDKWMPKH